MESSNVNSNSDSKTSMIAPKGKDNNLENEHPELIEPILSRLEMSKRLKLLILGVKMGLDMPSQHFHAALALLEKFFIIKSTDGHSAWLSVTDKNEIFYW